MTGHEQKRSSWLIFCCFSELPCHVVRLTPELPWGTYRVHQEELEDQSRTHPLMSCLGQSPCRNAPFKTGVLWSLKGMSYLIFFPYMKKSGKCLGSILILPKLSKKSG